MDALLTWLRELGQERYAAVFAGKREKTQEHFTTATMLYREMDMQFWLERAEVEVRGLG